MRGAATGRFRARRGRCGACGAARGAAGLDEARLWLLSAAAEARDGDAALWLRSAAQRARRAVAGPLEPEPTPAVQPRAATPAKARRSGARTKRLDAKSAAGSAVRVTVTGREGVNDCINAVYTTCGEYKGRWCFLTRQTCTTSEPQPIYLYYDPATDCWCIGDSIGSRSYYAVCGPSKGQDLAQPWRIWEGKRWANDLWIRAAIEGA